ncbi:MAG: C45 family peptidase [Polyangiales bacterium]
MSRPTIRALTPEHLVDLLRDPEDRFREFGRENRTVLRKLLGRARREVSSYVPTTWLEGAAGVLARVYGDHPYVRELEGLARSASVGLEELYLANIAYDITSVAGATGLIGCTGMVHGGGDSQPPMIARNMDWVFPTGIGAHSCVFRFVDDHGSYLSVGFPGVTGVISALSSHGFALTVNQAFHCGLPSFTSLPVPWLTRLVMDSATSYASARRVLATTAAATSSYLLLAGSRPGEAARVVSHGSSDDVLAVGKDRYAVVANHDPDEDFDVCDGEDGDSYARHRALEKRAAGVGAGDIRAARLALSRWPVSHASTVHQMVLVPASGELHLRCPHRGQRGYAVHKLERESHATDGP